MWRKRYGLIQQGSAGLSARQTAHSDSHAGLLRAWFLTVATLAPLACALPGSAIAAGPSAHMDASDFEYIADRTPTVFDAYYRYRDLYQDRHPYFFLHIDVVSGPDFVIPTLLGDRTAGVEGAFLSVGSVPWMFSPTGGICIGADAFLAGLTVKGTKEEKAGLPEQWSHGSMLFYASLFDTQGGWSATVGSQVRTTPFLQDTGTSRVFSHLPDKETEGQVDKKALVLAGTVPTPWFGLDVGVVVSDEGFESLSASGRMFSTDLIQSFGPHVASYPQLDNYQAGLHLDGLKVVDRWLELSSEASMRWTPGVGIAFDHAYLKTRTVFLKDREQRNEDFRTWDASIDTDFHLGLNLHGSFVNLPGSRNPWGAGFLLEFLSIYLWGLEGGISAGASYNFYEDMIQLPLPNVITGRAVLSLGI